MKCPTPVSVPDPNAKHKSIRFHVPCGKCGACRHNRRSEWSFRLKQEARDSLTAIFCTFTYRDDNLPFTEDGEVTLRKKDWQDFMKRLRWRQSQITHVKVRYYAVGEYGTNTSRPHYHSLLFNVDKRLFKHLDEIWSHGHCHVDIVNDNTIHYCTKYHVNYEKKGEDREDEFSVMSLKPAIGYIYLKKNAKFHKESGNFFVYNNGFKQKLPRYYKNKIFTDQERQMNAEKYISISDESYNREIRRLKSLLIQDPHSELYRRELAEAKKVRKKSNENNLF